jgi:hypothetical protein
MQGLSIHLPVADVPFSLPVLVGLGFVVGVLATFFGVGGGWIVTPALNALGLPMPFAVGTGLAAITGQSALAVVKHGRMGNVDWRLGAVVGGSMVLGVEGGAQTVMWLESLGLAEVVVRWVYIIFLSALGTYMLRDYAREMGRRASEGGANGENGGLVGRSAALRAGPAIRLANGAGRVAIWVPAVLGLGVGFLAGLMGTGGGFALVPAFVYVIGVPTVAAVGTSLKCVLISGGYGAFSYALKGRADLVVAFCMLAGAAVGAQFGAMAVRRVRGYSIRLLYALMIILAALGVVLKQLGHSTPAAVAILGGAGAMCLLLLGQALRPQQRAPAQHDGDAT